MPSIYETMQLPDYDKLCFLLFSHEESSGVQRQEKQYLGRALGMELKPQGIHSLVICPGNMETEMNVRDGDHPGKVGLLPYLDMEKLTRKALEKAEKGTGVYTPGSFYKVYRFFSKLLPHRLMMKITAL